MKFKVGDMVHWHSDKRDIGYITRIGQMSFYSEYSVLVYWFNNSEVSEFRISTDYLHICT